MKIGGVSQRSGAGRRRRLMTLRLAVMWLGVVAVAHTQDAPATVIKAARLFDGRGNAVETPGVVLVVAGRIAAVGSAVKAPANARTIDLGDATLLPGFREFIELVKAGMAPADALKTAMTVDADPLGLSADVGALAPGKLVDMVAVPGDPTRGISA